MLLLRSPADGRTAFDVRIPTAVPFTRGDVTEPGCKKDVKVLQVNMAYGKIF
jgi:hypothetical protein